MSSPFNPLDKTVLARTVAKALLEKPCGVLPPTDTFPGAGIYAIYYTGVFPSYAKIAALNRGQKFLAPIYVGKAIPEGGRKGKSRQKGTPGRELLSRLGEHAESIEQAKNLELSDFTCRYLVVEDIWIPLAERLLLQTYLPLWNRIVDGFGNHDPGVRRRHQHRSAWDVLHPGRTWVEKLGASNKTPQQINGEIGKFLAGWQAGQI